MFYAVVKERIERRDKNGRRMCFDDGKRVACDKKPDAAPKKPGKEDKPKATKVTQHDVHELLTDLLVQPKNITKKNLEQVGQLLMKLTVKDITEVAAQLAGKVKLTGAKVAKAQQLAEAVIEQVRAARKGSKKPAEKPKPTPPPPPPPEKPKPPPPEKPKPPPPPPPDDDDELNIEVPPETKPKPKPPPEEVTKPRPTPKPPEPGFTGTDSLGRKWVNGKLVPAEREMPKNPHRGAVKDPASQPSFKPIHEPLDGVEASTLKSIVNPATVYNGVYSTKTRVKLADNDEEAEEYKRLQKEGLLKCADEYCHAGTLTARGAYALELKRLGLPLSAMGKDTPKPTTDAEADAIGAFVNSLNGKQILAVAKHYGVELPDWAKTSDFGLAGKEVARALKVNAAIKRNPSIAEVVRSKDLEASVDSIAALDYKSDADIKKLQKDIDYEIRMVEAQFNMMRKGTTEYNKTLVKLSQLNMKHHDIAEDAKKHNAKVFDEVTKLIGAKDPTKISVDSTALDMYKDIAPTAKKRCADAAEWLGKVVDGGGEFPTFKLDYTDPRACYNGDKNTVNVGSGDTAVMVHEMIHGIEQKVPGVLSACIAFVEYRCHGEKPTDMSEVSKGSGYKKGEEFGRKDSFDKVLGGRSKSAAYYAGKVYGTMATEVLTMGVEQFYRNPVEFARKDPEYCAFVVGILNGSARHK